MASRFTSLSRAGNEAVGFKLLHYVTELDRQLAHGGEHQTSKRHEKAPIGAHNQALQKLKDENLDLQST
jgi:hypothetical protein